MVECVRQLKKIKHLVYIRGNHDDWTERWLGAKLIKNAWGLHFQEYRQWGEQGGIQTLDSMEKHDAYEEVFDFLSKAVNYHEEDYNLFVHGGLNDRTQKAKYNTPFDLMWDRSLVQIARMESISMEPTVKQYDLCFVGHTPTIYYESTVPVRYNNVWMLDTGVAYSGKLTIMDVKTKKFWQNK